MRYAGCMTEFSRGDSCTCPPAKEGHIGWARNPECPVHGNGEQRENVAFVLDAETLTPQAVVAGCPHRVLGPFLGSDASYLGCSKLIDHDGPHTFYVEWTTHAD